MVCCLQASIQELEAEVKSGAEAIRLLESQVSARGITMNKNQVWKVSKPYIDRKPLLHTIDEVEITISDRNKNHHEPNT